MELINSTEQDSVIHQRALRSDEMHEILNHNPNWLIRWGISSIFLWLLLLLLASYIVKYPDIVATRITLNTHQLPVKVRATANGNLTQLAVKNGDTVSTRDILAVIDHTTQYTAWRQLKQQITAIEQLPTQQAIEYAKAMPNIAHLGNLQLVYAELVQKAQRYRQITLPPFRQQQSIAINTEIETYRRLQNSLDQQQNLLQQEITLQQRNVKRYIELLSDGQASKLQTEQEQTRLLQLERSLKDIQWNQQQYNAQIASLETQLAQQEFQTEEQKIQTIAEWESALARCRSNLAEWEKQYVVYAPISGKIAISDSMQQQTTLQIGNEILSIVPIQANNTIIGTT